MINTLFYLILYSPRAKMSIPSGQANLILQWLKRNHGSIILLSVSATLCLTDYEETYQNIDTENS